MNKKMLAVMEKSSQFHQKREALIEKIYDADEIGQRILNGDGGNWIKEFLEQKKEKSADDYLAHTARTYILPFCSRK